MNEMFQESSQVLFLLGLVLATVIMLRIWYRKHGRKARLRRRAERVPHTSAPSTPLLDAPPDVVRWQVEMHELARELKAELDTKMSALQALLRDAEVQQRRLQETLQQASCQSGGAPGGAEPLSPAHPAGGEAETRVSPPVAGSAGELSALSGDRALIYRLADAGQDAGRIAAATGRPQADVERILRLRPAER